MPVGWAVTCTSTLLNTLRLPMESWDPPARLPRGSHWQLPVVFVCKDNHWEISTQFSAVARSKLSECAHGFGLPALEVDGNDVKAFGQLPRKPSSVPARVMDRPSYMPPAYICTGTSWEIQCWN